MIRLPFSTFDPLSNRRTSQVLFLMIRGVDTPTTIANELNVKPPAVMDQLHKLRKVRVIQPGEKTGKDQHYAIDWDRLAKESIRRTVAPHYWPGVYTDTHAAEFVKQFPKFALFLRSYFETFLSTHDDEDKRVKHEMLVNPTFSEQLDVLHSTLIAELDDIFKRLSIDESSVRQVSESLREWIRTTHPSNPWDVELVDKTLSKLGFKVRGEVTPESLTPKESPYELILLREGLIVRDEKTGKYEVTDEGMRFLTEWEEARPKTLPAWLRNKEEAKLVASVLSAILS